MTDKQRFEQLLQRIVRLETITQERWDAHDKRSEEWWGYVKRKLEEYSTKPTECRREWQAYMWKMIGFCIGMPTTIGAIIGLWMLLGDK